MNLPVFEDFRLRPLSSVNLDLFKCDAKLRHFFVEQARESEDELITKTYFLCRDTIEEPLVGFSLSNTAIEACMELNMAISNSSQYRIYPAVLIGRFATHEDHLRQGYGRLAVDLIKTWFITENKTGCRFIVVDSRPDSTPFYLSCDFEYYPVQRHQSRTELLFFDLKAFKRGLSS